VAAPRLRRALAAAAGLGLTVAVDTPLALGAPPTATTPTTTTPTTSAPIEPARSPASMPASEPGVATLELVDPAPVEPDSPAEARAPMNLPDAAPEVSVWTIRPGDHLWGLATDALREHGREPSDREVADYVAVVVEQNRDALVVPGHPDLVLPGQVFVRPPLP
jgi:nucleoid-associated protein YgaU